MVISAANMFKILTRIPLTTKVLEGKNVICVRITNSYLTKNRVVLTDREYWLCALSFVQTCPRQNTISLLLPKTIIFFSKYVHIVCETFRASG